MMRSMFSGISGLRNHQTRMDVIGNNIANVNTMGFKGSRVTFQEIFTQTLRGPSSPTPMLGGTDPLQVGLGVQLASIDTLNTPGNIQTTGQVTDLAIQGEGYFVVSDGPTASYTRAGDFKLDGTHFLANSRGLRVQGWLAINGVFEPKTEDNLGNLRIVVGEIEGTQVQGVAYPSTVRMNTGNTSMLAGRDQFVLNITSGTVKDSLSARDLTITGLPEGLRATAAKHPLSNQIIVTISGTPIQPETLLQPQSVKIVVNESAISETDGVASNPFALRLEPALFAPTAAAVATDPVVVMAAGDTNVSANSSFVLDVTSGTVKDTLTAADIDVTGLPTGLYPQASKDPDGNRIIVTLSGSAVSADGKPAPISADLSPQVVIRGSALAESGATDSAPIALSLRKSGAQTAVKISGKTINSTLIMAAGNRQLTRDNTWEIDITEGTLDGALSVPADISVNGLPAGLTATASVQGNRLRVTLSGAAVEPIQSPINVSVTVNPGAITESDIKQTPPAVTGSNVFNLTLSPVAAAPETAPIMKSYTIDSTGIITGSFADGTSRAIAQVALAEFSNARGLIRQGDGLLSRSNNSGRPVYGEAGTGGRGFIAPSSLEMSNVDLASEFTNMIITQRGFQANSRIITTSDEMLQELANIKR